MFKLGLYIFWLETELDVDVVTYRVDFYQTYDHIFLVFFEQFQEGPTQASAKK